MRKGNARAEVLAGLLVGMWCLAALAQETTQSWQDNERKFKSSDPNYNVRRSEHFRILWGNGPPGRGLVASAKRGDVEECTPKGRARWPGVSSGQPNDALAFL